MKCTLWFIGCLLVSVGALASDERVERLTPEHRKWLEEEVVYIILDRERDVFLSLETVEERERLIEAFWRRRDPNRATPENEFKDEHYRRIEYANEKLGRHAFRPGWKTDQGRIYTILGKPVEIQRFEAYHNLAYTQIWTYQVGPATGLPPFFHLLFFKRYDVGEYRLYSPQGDGPLSLIRGLDRYTNDPTVALRELLDISPDLAHASLTFDMSENADFVTGRPSLGSELIVGRIAEVPKRAVRTDYIDAWLHYGNKVSAEYSFNFIPSRSVFAVLAGPDGTPFVHYRIELDPQNFSLGAEEDRSKYYTTLDVSLEVTDPEGNRVLVKDKEVYVELSPAEIKEFNAAPFAYQDDFPLVPGEFKATVILRNRVGSQFTVAEHALRVEPVSSEKPGLGELVLGYKTERTTDGAAQGEVRTFQIGNHRVHAASDNVFFNSETVHVFFQVYGAASDHTLQLAMLSGEEVIDERTLEVGDDPTGPLDETFPLMNMFGGRYLIRARLVEPSGSVVAEKSATLQVSARKPMPRPWVHSRSFDSRIPGSVPRALGEQFLALGRFEEARQQLEMAVAANPELAEARWRLAGLYLGWREADRALELLLPLKESFSNRYEVVAGLGFAFYIKNDAASAVPYLELASTLRPAGTSLLNALGGCYQRLGQADKARESFQRSLKLNPEQEAIQQQLASLPG